MNIIDTIAFSYIGIGAVVGAVLFFYSLGMLIEGDLKLSGDRWDLDTLFFAGFGLLICGFISVAQIFVWPAVPIILFARWVFGHLKDVRV